jgi:hypothetical protein
MSAIPDKVTSAAPTQSKSSPATAVTVEALIFTVEALAVLLFAALVVGLLVAWRPLKQKAWQTHLLLPPTVAKVYEPVSAPVSRL